jgi:hypothetical protein
MKQNPAFFIIMEEPGKGLMTLYNAIKNPLSLLHLRGIPNPNYN